MISTMLSVLLCTSFLRLRDAPATGRPNAWRWRAPVFLAGRLGRRCPKLPRCFCLAETQGYRCCSEECRTGRADILIVGRSPAIELASPLRYTGTALRGEMGRFRADPT